MMNTTRTESQLLTGLTAPQREAVTHVDGPLLVLAGPGSGKTRVITGRIGHLVTAVGIPSWNILAITFTNKAAGEMRLRIERMVDERDARRMTISTFHSLCARLLRIYADRVGLAPGYSIYDTGDQKNAIKAALEHLEISSKNFPPASMLAAISSAKNELLDAEGYKVYANDFQTRTVYKVYKQYEKILERNQAVDFDDLLLKTVQLFRNHPDVLDECRRRYQYILIDEYQDTNHAQFVLANALAAEHQNLCATGDPDQSIYAWRGANIRNILDFESHYPDAKVVRLEQNFRSTSRILAAADTLIRSNSRRKHKELWTENDEGDSVATITCRDERHEANWVARKFKELHEEHDMPWGGMAVFYRINSLSRVVEEAMRDAAIPYQIARGTAFYERKEIKDAVSFLRVITNPADEVNLFRIINTPSRGISANSVKSLQAFAVANNRSIDRVIAEPMSVTNLNTRAQNAIVKFSNMVQGLRQMAGLAEPEDGDTKQPDMSLRGFVEHLLIESGLHEFYRNDKSDPDQERLANLGEFVTSAQQFEEDFLADIEIDAAGDVAAQPDEPPLREKLLAFLERISLVSDIDAVDNAQGAVTLMTLHAAKGLEFPVVAIVGVEDGLLPHSRAKDDQHELEEERRLLFVGMTRAMQRLFISHARYRTIFGQTQATVASRFLRELPKDDIDVEDLTSEFDADDILGSRSRRATPAGRTYPAGTIIDHPQFGLGKVLSVTPMGSHTRAKIQFESGGARTLILEYAKLTKVEDF